ncbi:MAG: MEKHLA domain-containing protein [Verrucomicrobiales bacterium]|nr:MEKHLA domain-containing protein [Verrucomicrobiales bacterium]
MSINIEDHVALLFESFERATGRILWDDSWAKLNAADLVTAFEEAPCVIASHDTSDDPVLNYGNPTALNLWEANWEQFTSMPSRLTAEPVERSERERLLHEVSTNGYIDNYSGIRISTRGKRFLIRQATVWTVIDVNGIHRGQAVVFLDWEFI